MTYRTRINYTAAQKTEMWDRWQRGESLKGHDFIIETHAAAVEQIHETLHREQCAYLKLSETGNPNR